MFQLRRTARVSAMALSSVIDDHVISQGAVHNVLFTPDSGSLSRPPTGPLAGPVPAFVPKHPVSGVNEPVRDRLEFSVSVIS